MRTLEGIRYLINLDSAEIQQNLPEELHRRTKWSRRWTQLEYLYVKSRVGRNQTKA
mgnify:CR=1 FL=1